MGRRQETRWIYRWSRLLIAGIAAVGMGETAYLTVTELMGKTATCPLKGCELALSSPYATIAGLPLTLFGFLAYTVMFILAILPLMVRSEQAKLLRRNLETRTWPLLFGMATVMVVFSSYLMFILATEIQAACLYCIASASFAMAMFLLTLFGQAWDDAGQLLFTGIIVAMVTLTGTLALYAPIRGISSTSVEARGEIGPPITTTSGPAEIALARHLASINAKMYGAWWCPHCHDQKQLFGAEAMALIPYVECASDGLNAQPESCRSQTQITGFPTWEIQGSFYAGAQTLERLAELSGYTGPQDFRA